MSETLLRDNYTAWPDEGIDQKFAHACFTGDAEYVLLMIAADGVDITGVKAHKQQYEQRRPIDQSTDYYARLTAYAMWRNAKITPEYLAIFDALLQYRGKQGQFVDLRHEAIEMQPNTSGTEQRAQRVAEEVLRGYANLALTEYPSNQEGLRGLSSLFTMTRYGENPYILTADEFEDSPVMALNANTGEIDTMPAGTVVYIEPRFTLHRYDVLTSSAFLFSRVIGWSVITTSASGEHGLVQLNLAEIAADGAAFGIVASRGSQGILKYMQLLKLAPKFSTSLSNTLYNFVANHQSAAWQFYPGFEADRVRLINAWVEVMNMLGLNMDAYTGDLWPPPPLSPTASNDDDDSDDETLEYVTDREEGNNDSTSFTETEKVDTSTENETPPPSQSKNNNDIFDDYTSFTV